MSSHIDSAFIPGGGEDILKDALKSSFLVNFRTGNVLVDTLSNPHKAYPLTLWVLYVNFSRLGGKL